MVLSSVRGTPVPSGRNVDWLSGLQYNFYGFDEHGCGWSLKVVYRGYKLCEVIQNWRQCNLQVTYIQKVDALLQAPLQLDFLAS